MKIVFGIFKKHGFEYRPVLQNEKAILYSQIDFGNDSGGKIIGYEVHKKKFRKSKTINLIHVREGVRRPHDEDFGVWAWTFYPDAYGKALAKYSEIS